MLRAHTVGDLDIQPTQRFLFWIAFAWILTTTLVRRPDANTLGLRLSGLRSSLWITAGGLFFAGLLVGIALELHTLHPLHGAGPLGLHMAGYLLWAFEQQFILQDYFLLRLLRILPNQSAAVITAAVLFSTAHLPNLVLTVATLGLGNRLVYSLPVAIATFTHSGLSMASWASAWRFQCRMRSLTT